MITVFSAPKPFSDPHTRLIQMNALESWKRLGHNVEVLLFGRDRGIDRVAHKLGFRHFPEVPVSNWGVPLLDAIFFQAQKESRFDQLLFVNADIILPRKILETAKILSRLPNFLAVGQRFDLDVTWPINFSDQSWEADIFLKARTIGDIHPPAGSDFFLFHKDPNVWQLPPFRVGRNGWDNWMIYHARQHHVPVVDLTREVMVIHQSHDYKFLPDPGTHGHWQGADGAANIAMVGGKDKIYNILDATHFLWRGKIFPNWTLTPFRHHLGKFYDLKIRKLA